MISSVKLDKGLFSSAAGLRNSGRRGMIEKLAGTEYNGGEEAVITAIPKDKADEFHATHQKMPKRIYSSAGDGYFESFDYGESWKRITTGLKHHYLAGLAVDSGDPQNVIVSASHSAWQAHSIEAAESLVYRRYLEGEDDDGNNQEWKPITNTGLPEPSGTIISILSANPKIAGEFYAINNRGIFCCTDLGSSWKMLAVRKVTGQLKTYFYDLPEDIRIKLTDHGLTGENLKLKLGIVYKIRRELWKSIKDIQNNDLVETIINLSHKLLDAADSVLDSLADVFSGLKAVKEIKELVRCVLRIRHQKSTEQTSPKSDNQTKDPKELRHPKSQEKVIRKEDETKAI